MSRGHRGGVEVARRRASYRQAGRRTSRLATAQGTRIKTVQDIANDLVALCREGKFGESGEKYWAQDVLRVEAGAPGGGDPASRGIDAARGKGEWWSSNHDVHGVEVEGPYVNGDQFVVRFKMDMTPKATGQRTTMDEMAVYTIKDGKIAEERFFYGS